MSTAALRRLAWVLIGLLVVAAWWGGLGSPWVYDDKIEVVGNGTIRDLEQWKAIATYNVSRPLLVLTYAVDFDRNGLEPRGYHVTNLGIAVLLAGAALFLAEGLFRLGGRSRPLLRAAVVAALWLVHPMSSEAITYITGRSELLCAVFCLLSLGAWAQALVAEDEGGGWRAGAAWRLLGLAGFLGAVTTKEVGAMVPAAALVLELVLGRGGGKRLVGRLLGVRWAWYLPYALLIGTAAWLRLQHAESFLPREVDRPLGVQLVTQTEAWLHYLRLWLVPWGQTIFHHLEDVDPVSLHGGLSVLGWLLVVGAAALWGRRVPLAGVALLCGAFFLLPSSSAVPLKENMAEHRAFQTGFWLLVAVVGTVRGPWAKRAAWAAVPVGAVLVGLTQLRHQAWATEVGLWQEAVAQRPGVAEAWYGVGDAHRFVGELDAAEQAYEKVLELSPEHLDARNNLGIVRASRGDVAGAREAWMAALEQSPTYCKAHANLGTLAFGLRDWDEARTEFRTALAYCPDNAVAHLGLCQLHYDKRRDKDLAIYHCEAYIALAPLSDATPKIKEWLFELTF